MRLNVLLAMVAMASAVLLPMWGRLPAPERIERIEQFEARVANQAARAGSRGLHAPGDERRDACIGAVNGPVAPRAHGVARERSEG